MTTIHGDHSDSLYQKTKACSQCGAIKPLADFLRRTGRRSGKQSRRGTCRACRQHIASSASSLSSTHSGGKRATIMAREDDGLTGGAVPEKRHADSRGDERVQEKVAEDADQAGPETSAALERKKPKRKRRRRGGPIGKAPHGESSGNVKEGDGGESQRGAQGGSPEGSKAIQQAQQATSRNETVRGKTAGEASGQEKPGRARTGKATANNHQRNEAFKGSLPGGKKPGYAAKGRRSGAATGQAMLPRDRHDPHDASMLKPTRQGFIRMRGKSDNGRKWYQEIDPELAEVLVKEGAAVVVNRSTIRRLFSNKEFRRMVLTRDAYTCHFCGKYGDTIDHKLPRAKGGHTTPMNCVCACYECNQLKASHDLDDFITRFSDQSE